MTSNDKLEFLRVLMGLASIKPGKPLTPEGLEVYWLAMSEWPMDDFRAAASHLAKSVEFMPNPYHFEQLRKGGEDTAGEAWAQVLAVVRRMNRNELVSISPQIDRVVRAMGGYGSLSLMTAEEQPWRAKRFTELFGEIGEAEEVREVLMFGGQDLKALAETKRIA
jgi:hypothetical protein